MLKDNPAEVARDGFEALMVGTVNVPRSPDIEASVVGV
jgi:hypothetical protein